MKRFEEIKVWEQSRQFNKLLFEIVKKKDSKEVGFIVNHMYKTAGNVMDNIAEGFERNGNREFIQFLSIAKASAGEMRSQLYRALDTEIIDSNEFEQLKHEIEAISRQLSSFITYLKKSDRKGYKFEEKLAEYKTKSKNKNSSSEP